MEPDEADGRLARRDLAGMPPEMLARYRAFMSREAPGVAQEWMQVDSYKARFETLDTGMITLLHELTVGVFWPHRRSDLEMLLQLGNGYMALDEIGRPLGTAMRFSAGSDFAMLGMMVTTPRLQSHGTGARLLRRVMEDCGGRDLRLSATRSGYRLYEGAGFAPVGLINQHQGIARPIYSPPDVPGVTLRAFAPTDLDAVLALDASAYGADRRATVARLAEVSDVQVAERDGAAIGFAMLRRFGKGRVIGPMVAEEDGVAMLLAAAFIAPRAGEFLRLDTPAGGDRFSAFLAAAGLGVFDTVTEMRLGRMRRPQEGPQIFGLAAHSLG